jgi:glycosyltransferase involved in cell wall biosynthesis
MKILVGNNGLGPPGGSETYTYALCKELKRQGHTVHAVGKIGPGKVSDRLEKIGIPCYFKPISGNYDLILLSHSSSIELAKDTKGFKIQTCHGVYPALEQPINGMDAYVSISEEVKEHLNNLGYNSTVIHNGIDCLRYRPINPINKTLKTVLSLAHSDSANEIIKRACDIAGVKLIIHNKFRNFSWEMDEIINNADLVISLGRGAYESMASGRNVIIFDHRGYTKMPAIGDGMITKNNAIDYLHNNCSGRFTKKEFNADLLAKEMLKYDYNNGKELREYALNHLNIELQVQKYLNLIPN